MPDADHEIGEFILRLARSAIEADPAVSDEHIDHLAVEHFGHRATAYLSEGDVREDLHAVYDAMRKIELVERLKPSS
jgi:hypothetical protein